MATVNFSIPDEIKDRFNKAFANRNKSQIIADLMRKAVEEQAQKEQRARVVDALLSRRGRRPVVKAGAVRKARQVGRP
jgi:metal-responsive CopG/Arc/MetJ family transcriptional regulator